MATFEVRDGDFEDPTGANDMYGLKPDGTTLNLTEGKDGGWSYDGSLSADGRSMVYAWGPAEVGGGGPVAATRIYLRDLTTGEDTLLLEGENLKEPSLSPDGSTVALTSSIHTNMGLRLTLLTVANPGISRPVATKDLQQERFDRSPAWSPDGSKIATVSLSLSDGALSSDQAAIIIYEVADDTGTVGSNESSLFSVKNDGLVMTYDIYGLDWSSDGAAVLAVVTSAGAEDSNMLTTIDVASGKITEQSGAPRQSVKFTSADEKQVSSLSDRAFQTWTRDPTTGTPLPSPSEMVLKTQGSLNGGLSVPKCAVR